MFKKLSFIFLLCTPWFLTSQIAHAAIYSITQTRGPNFGFYDRVDQASPFRGQFNVNPKLAGTGFSASDIEWASVRVELFDDTGSDAEVYSFKSTQTEIALDGYEGTFPFSTIRKYQTYVYYNVSTAEQEGEKAQLGFNSGTTVDSTHSRGPRTATVIGGDGVYSNYAYSGNRVQIGPVTLNNGIFIAQDGCFLGTVCLAEVFNRTKIFSINERFVDSSEWEFRYLLEEAEMSDLMADGLLDYNIASLLGDFWFKSATLSFGTPEDEGNSTNSGPGLPAVPVPATIWLFGTALIGLVGFSKRRKAA